ncbi:hypothetical protein SAMN05421640_0451 [Ekhidna lutea]|uniref:Uncharacterized protein n=1 Tax=Ekhidna lutea TaxID=447679 RepID=A0A239F379_EKHLU|nr:hypothetical protein [Ekhidna lutea]SNS50978.1 hypothetical protein SAMN05421640_0451 [Ekhidna lutea]
MLFLLRKIRRKLLAQNKVTSYLFYAIGEILLVVIGILIAVQIDGWNDQRKVMTEEEGYLKRLIAENKQDIGNFSRLIEDLNVAMQSIDIFCATLNDKSASDSVILYTAQEYMNYGSIVPLFSSSRSTFDDLSNTGNLKVISNITLRDQIIHHYAEVLEVQKRMNINSDWALALDMAFINETYGMKYVPITAHLFPTKTKRQLANELRKNKFQYINNAAVGYWADTDALNLLNALKQKSNELIIQIENELNQD